MQSWLNALRVDLAGGPITDWDYWGMAPDRLHPSVGTIWLSSYSAPTQGNPEGVAVFSLDAALWAETPATLQGLIFDYTDFISSRFSNVKCPAELSKLGADVSVTELKISPPSSSAASSAQPRLGGVWSLISTSIQVQ